ncbi:putative membrane protein [Vibrio parahaemolyticus VPTS-2010_2]|nr:putative membrane protein [Vibrio parahaemolyticus VPTS-2010_2]
MLPDMDEASAEEKALVFLAWSGLVVMASFLVYFKLYVW